MMPGSHARRENSSMPTTEQYRVRVWYDSPGTRDAGQTFGLFGSRDAAEKCLTAVASRPDVKAAEIEKLEEA